MVKIAFSWHVESQQLRGVYNSPEVDDNVSPFSIVVSLAHVLSQSGVHIICRHSMLFKN